MVRLGSLHFLNPAKIDESIISLYMNKWIELMNSMNAVVIKFIKFKQVNKFKLKK